MFVYGTNDFGNTKCESGVCPCYCERESEAGECDEMVDNTGYKLYKYLAWAKIADKKECGGSEESKGTKKTLEECAKSCKGISSLFIYATNDFGSKYCKTNGMEDCPCYCETSSTDGRCKMGQLIDNGAYKLYKYVS